jgi:membrane protein
MGDDSSVGTIVQALSNAITAVERGAATVRRRSRLVDHVWRAQDRYFDVCAGRLAAAIAYYGFFAALALAVLVFAVLGAALRGNDAVVHAVREYLQRNLPQLNVTTLFEASQQVRTIAIIALVVAGVGWVETLRSSQRAVWGLIQQPGHFVIRWLVDLAVFVGLAILLTVSLAVSAGLQDVVLRLAANWERSGIGSVLRGSSTLIAAGVDVLLAVAVLVGVPRLRIPLRRLVPSALLVVVGLWLLKTIGRWYVVRSQHNPAYRLVAAAVGLLLFMYLFNQLILFAAALAATSRHGTVIDLAAGPPPLTTGPPPAAVPAPELAAAAQQVAAAPTATGPPAHP